MLQKHETCGMDSHKRNLVLPKKTVLQTIFAALMLWLLGFPTFLAAAGNQLPVKNSLPPVQQAITAPAPTLESHFVQFQLKKPLEAGGQLSVTEISPRLETTGYDFDACMGSNAKTVNVIVKGPSSLPDDDWALIEVLDASGNIAEKYLVNSMGGITGVSDLEH